MGKIVIVGEGMLELSRGSGEGWQLGSGGDTLNTAIHLARLGADVSFMTALGNDDFSADLRQSWAAEGLQLDLVATDPARLPGLYAISTDEGGERHFTYWRNESAARHLFALHGIDELLRTAEQASLLVFSMISLAILPAVGRGRLLELASAVRRNGGKVAFDTNYRPRLWPDLATAQFTRLAALEVSDIGLPTREDEALLTGTDEAARIAQAWQDAGVAEVVIKGGPDGCWVGGEQVRPSAVLSPVDTSGAGDAFNAAYLHARLAGMSPHAAALAGHRLAGWVVMNRGAIPPNAPDAPYAALNFI